MIKLHLNDIQVESQYENITIFQLCYLKGIHLPCFCYHEKLSIAGNCRMCLIQVNQGIGIACALSLMEDMLIFTDTKRVRDSREFVLEFLLSNHPLDCPICDQGGECDLQDLSLNYGTDRGRFYEQKRSVTNLNLGLPIIKTIMTRCIHCTRCVRFATEIGDFSLGIMGRGVDMEIGNYIELCLQDELSGNIIDLCPVGALTSMPYAFTSRPWELSAFSNIDFLDALGSSLKLYVYNNEIKRILPILDEYINEDWLTNKARFSYDALSINRLLYPKMRIHTKLVVFSWNKIIPVLLKFIFLNFYKQLKIVLGSFLDLKICLSLKKFFNSFGCGNFVYSENLHLNKLNFDFRFFYLLNLSILELEKVAFVLFLSTNLRMESPLLNSRIRKNYLLNPNIMLFSIGLSLQYLTYPIKNLGNNISVLFNFFKGKLRSFCSLFFKNLSSFSFFNKDIYLCYKPVVLIGFSIIRRFDWSSFFFLFFFNLKKQLHFLRFNFVSSTLGFLSFSELCLQGLKFLDLKKQKEFVYIVHEDSVFVNNKVSIFQGYLNPLGSIFLYSTFLLPIKAPYEYDCLFLNLEGRYRVMQGCLKSMLEIYEDSEIFNILSVYNKTFNICKFSILKNFYLYYSYFKNWVQSVCTFFYVLNDFVKELFFYTSVVSIQSCISTLVFFNIKLFYNLKFVNSNFFRFINNYYSSDFFLKNSKIMSLCSLKTFILNW